MRLCRTTMGIAFSLVAFSLSNGQVAKIEKPESRPELSNRGELIPAASSRHVVRAGDQSIPYVVNWSEKVLKTPDGQPQAAISATSYLRADVQDPARRPVVFAFNGGPGASSSPLHFGILGPRGLTEPDPQGARIFFENAETLLDAADLVMIDPVGTGFSRELTAGGGQPYWNPAGDAKSVELLIREWLGENKRTGSPVFIIGESYGGYRLALMANEIADLNIAGLVLISPATDFSRMGDDQGFVFSLPSMAAAAFAHGAARPKGKTVAEVFDAARAFAQSDYAAALQLGSELAPADRDRMAERMSRLIGLPAAAIAAANIRVNTQDFLEQLVPDRIVGRLDTRVTGPNPKKALVAGRSKAADDPVLNMGSSNVKKSPWIRDYLRNEVGVNTDRDYISLTLDVNFAFNWNSGSKRLEDNLRYNATPGLAKLMKDRPTARLLLMGGYYDLATPWLAQRFALNHAGVPLDRTRMVAFAGGHTVYESEGMRKLFSRELHDFVGGAQSSTK
jgi:carboxypeptidase C (cathepsin A)